jgi:hypothetical protein
MNEDFPIRIDTYLSGKATPEEIRELDLILREHESARKLFLISANQEADLSEILSDTSGEAVAHEIDNSVQAVQRPCPAIRRGSRKLLAVAAAVLLLVGLASFFHSRNGSETPSLVRARITELRSSESLPLAVGQDIQPGDHIALKDAATATLTYDDGTRITLQKEAVVHFPAFSTNKYLVLDQGELYADVVPQPREHSMVVETPNAVVTVLGTRFRLTTSGREDRLAVEKGEVAVTEKRNGKRRRVQAGGTFNIGAGLVYNSVRRSRPATRVEEPMELTEPDPTQYIEGPILFAEDFEEGFDPEVWEPVRRMDGVLSEENEPADQLSIVPRKKEESTNHALRVTIPRGETHQLGVRLNRVFDVDAFSLSYEYTLAGRAKSGVNPICLALSKGYRSRTLYWNSECGSVVVPGKFNQVKLDYVFTKDKGEDVIDLRWYQNGEYGVRTLFYTGPAPVLFEVFCGAILFDNIVIRELIPLKGSPDEEE